MRILGARIYTSRLWMAVILVGALSGLVPQPASAQVADGVIEVVAQDESKAVLRASRSRCCARTPDSRSRT